MGTGGVFLEACYPSQARQSSTHLEGMPLAVGHSGDFPSRCYSRCSWPPWAHRETELLCQGFWMQPLAIREYVRLCGFAAARPRCGSRRIHIGVDAHEQVVGWELRLNCRLCSLGFWLWIVSCYWNSSCVDVCSDA